MLLVKTQVNSVCDFDSYIKLVLKTMVLSDNKKVKLLYSITDEILGDLLIITPVKILKI